MWRIHFRFSCEKGGNHLLHNKRIPKETHVERSFSFLLWKLWLTLHNKRIPKETHVILKNIFLIVWNSFQWFFLIRKLLDSRQGLEKKSSQEKYWKAFKYFFLTLWKVLKLIFPLIEKHRNFFFLIRKIGKNWKVI